MGYCGKYLPIKNYLESSKNLQEELSYSKIKEILKRDLPNSAYIYREWWSNGGHSQSDSWMEAGWKVEEVELKEKILFMKTDQVKVENNLQKNEENNLYAEKENIINFGCSLEELKQNLIDISQIAGCMIKPDQIQIIDRGKPHIPGNLDGKMGIYIFVFEKVFLKIGKANFNSNIRFQFQHYNAQSSKSNLAKSILNDPEMENLNLSENTVGKWIKENSRRVEILLDKTLSFFSLNFLEAFLQLKYKPKYEGFKSQREMI